MFFQNEHCLKPKNNVSSQFDRMQLCLNKKPETKKNPNDLKNCLNKGNNTKKANTVMQIRINNHAYIGDKNKTPK